MLMLMLAIAVILLGVIKLILKLITVKHYL